MDSSDLVHRYFEAMAVNDFDTLARLRHPDWHEDWPQSGERVPNNDAYRRIHESFPGGLPEIKVHEVAGAEDRWVMTPGMTVQRIAGTGDVWFIEGINRYAGDQLYHFVLHLRLRDGRVWRVTSYFAEPFPAPAWRAPMTVPIEPGGA